MRNKDVEIDSKFISISFKKGKYKLRGAFLNNN